MFHAREFSKFTRRSKKSEKALANRPMNDKRIKTINDKNLCRKKRKLSKIKMTDRRRPARPPERKLPKAAAYVVRPRTENRARPASGKAQPHQKRQCHVNLMDWQSHRTKRFDSEPTSFPSADADLHCQGTPNPIGWKQSDNCYQRPVTIDLRALTTMDTNEH
jgi:hypothetical protein